MRIAILAIDEAHKLSAEVLEEIRLLGKLRVWPGQIRADRALSQCELDISWTGTITPIQTEDRVAPVIDPLTAAETRVHTFRWAKAAEPASRVCSEAIEAWCYGREEFPG